LNYLELPLPTLTAAHRPLQPECSQLREWSASKISIAGARHMHDCGAPCTIVLYSLSKLYLSACFRMLAGKMITFCIQLWTTTMSNPQTYGRISLKQGARPSILYSIRISFVPSDCIRLRLRLADLLTIFILLDNIPRCISLVSVSASLYP
jgi:hypothetical protein